MAAHAQVELEALPAGIDERSVRRHSWRPAGEAHLGQVVERKLELAGLAAGINDDVERDTVGGDARHPHLLKDGHALVCLVPALVA